MSDFKRKNSFGGKRNFNKSNFKNDRPQMHQATCEQCGKSCEVPFRPTGSKPVYCRDCFNNNDSQSFDTRRNDRSQSSDRQMFDSVCSRCGENCKLPFRPTQGKDVFCSRCFDMNKGSDDRRSDRRSSDRPNNYRNDQRSNANNSSITKAEIEAINTKLDTILALLKPQPVEETPVEPVISEETIEELVEQVEEVKEEIEAEKPKKVRKARATTKKADSKTKKKASSK